MFRATYLGFLRFKSFWLVESGSWTVVDWLVSFLKVIDVQVKAKRAENVISERVMKRALNKTCN